MKYLLLIITAYFFIGCSAKEIPANLDELNKQYGCEVGDDAPLFKTELRDNSLFDFADTKGKVVMLDFWGAWCSICGMTRPDMKQLINDYSNNIDFEVLGISINDRPEKWIEYIEEHNLNWKHTQNSTKLSKDPQTLYCIQGVPAVILIDKHGKIRYRLNPINHDKLKEAIAELVNEEVFN
ncbi:MAG: TlpA family protein disulfide reductase [Candidatus Kapabacteria bacterium]|nr:TlpA family protein disulfide reductase [Ignavibacteriota bacterium]MCW5885056.1 TlpA family protein disulfide reductase [Candidatus Kapabacteria bacterium]